MSVSVAALGGLIELVAALDVESIGHLAGGTKLLEHRDELSDAVVCFGGA